MNFWIRMQRVKLQIMRTRFDQFWEKFIFVSSIIGLVVLLASSLFRYYYLVPRQEKATKDYRYIQQLKNENNDLKTQLQHLKKRIENE